MPAEKTRPTRKSSTPRPVSSISQAIPATKPTINVAVVGVFLFLILALGLIILAYYGAGGLPISGEDGAASTSCHPRDSKSCSVGPCDGTAICINGIWGGCNWEKTCVPGSRLSCTELSCFYGVRVCNSCGTGYGPCVSPE